LLRGAVGDRLLQSEATHAVTQGLVAIPVLGHTRGSVV